MIIDIKKIFGYFLVYWKIGEKFLFKNMIRNVLVLYL